MNKRVISIPKKPLALAIGSLLLSAPPGAWATDKVWACGSAWWSQSCWLSSDGGLGNNGQPQHGDAVTIDNQGANNLTVSYDNAAYPDAVLSSLTVRGASANATLNLGAGGYATPLKVNQERIGNNGYLAHSAGIHSVGELWLESSAAASGNYSGPGGYTLSGSGSLSAAKEYIRGAQMSFQQFGGSHQVDQQLLIASGRYNLAAGTLTAGAVTLGERYMLGMSEKQRAGHFNQSGGTHSVAGKLSIGGSYNVGGVDYFSDYVLAGNGQLHTGSTEIGSSVYEMLGAFYQLGGSHQVDGQLAVVDGRYYLEAGQLNAKSIRVADQFEQLGGTAQVADLLTIHGEYRLSGAAALSSGGVNIGGKLLQSGGNHQVAGELKVAAGFITQTGVETDGGRYQLSGGTLQADTLALGTAELNPNTKLVFTDAFVEQSGGQHNVVNANIGSKLNGGERGVYRLSGGVLNVGTATINANGSLIAEGGELQGNYLQNGSFTVNQTTQLNGNMTLGAKSDSRLNADLTLNGQMTVKNHLLQEHSLYGDGDLIVGSGGSLLGTGSVGVDIVNQGSIKAKGGNLTLAGNSLNNQGLLSNAAGSNLFVNAASFANNGNIEANAGGSVVIDQIVNNTAGHQVSLKGGTLEVAKLVNQTGATLSGFGNLSGSVQNNGNIDFYGPTNLIGNLYNDATLLVRNNQTLITGHTVNNGTIQTLKGTVIFEGGLTNNGAYISDPSDNYFTDLTITDIGYLVGETGDRFILTGDFINHSQQAIQWNTTAASLLFTGLGSQQLYLTGSDVGAHANGYHNNYAWSDLQIGSGAHLALFDGNDDDGGAFYTGLIIGAFLNGGEVANISGNGYNIYYNAALAGNAYLGGLTYNLQNGGRLIGLTSVPLPASAWLMLSSVLSMLFVQRRRKTV